MTKLTIEITTSNPAENVALLALPIAEAAGRLLHAAPGDTAVQVRRRAPEPEMEATGHMPVHAAVELDHVPNVSERMLLAFELADEIAHVVERPTDHVHVVLVTPGATPAA